MRPDSAVAAAIAKLGASFVAATAGVLSLNASADAISSALRYADFIQRRGQNEMERRKRLAIATKYSLQYWVNASDRMVIAGEREFLGLE